MLKSLLGLGALAVAWAASASAQPSAVREAVTGPALYDPVQHWEVDFETGVLWHFTGSATPLDYVLLPQILTIKSPAFLIDFPLGGGDLVLRNRFSLLAEPIAQGPEHHYFGVAGSGIFEWWDQLRTRCLFFSSGGGFGELDAHGQTIAGAQGQEFNLNWFAYAGARWRCPAAVSASLGVYFQHVSNGHLDKIDPGLNSIGPMLSVGWNF